MARAGPARCTGKVGADAAGSRGARRAPGRPKQLTAAHARALLPDLHRYTEGKPFRPPYMRAYLRRRLAAKEWRLPAAGEAERLLKCLARKRKINGEVEGPVGIWKPHGIRYLDPDGSGEASNLRGFARRASSGASTWTTWHEHGFIYRVHRALPLSKGAFQISCTRGFKRVSCVASRRRISVHTSRGRSDFNSTLILNPCRAGSASVVPQWTLIYLHNFSKRGTEYMNFPHYFVIGGVPIRVVIPTAPLQEQTCFKDWMVFRGKKLGWRRIKFYSWFNYLTDRGGLRENDIDLESLQHMREQLHCLISREVQQLGGDAKRVIVGGASQGCCVALDAALTYPHVLGGVIGLVGHVLGSTPLDPAKRSMPLHLFQEASDREMRWQWVKSAVQRLVEGGFNVHLRREYDPACCGHWIQDIEGTWVRSALRKLVFKDGLESAAPAAARTGV